METNIKQTFRSGVFALVLLAGAAAPAYAEEIYKWLMPDGTVLYTDVPYMNGKLQERLTVPPPDSKEAQDAARAKLKREAARADRSAENRILAVDAADAEVHAASLALEAAQIELHVGIQPHAGERIGIVGGHTRLSDAYWQRVRGLKRAVSDARERLREAYAARNAVK